MSFLISTAHAAEAAPAVGDNLVTLLMLPAIMIFFYFMIWRPQSKKNKEQKNLLGNLQVGDEVATIAGVIGRITKVTEQYLLVEVSEKVDMKFQKTAVTAVLPKGTIKSL